MSHWMHPDDIRTLFSRAMSSMYRKEVPQYGALCTLVEKVNQEHASPEHGAVGNTRLVIERHGAVRVGTAQELATLRRLFAVMGMLPVGYYDLSLAGVPVHATAFRPVGAQALARNPFRVFTSLLRFDLIADPALRRQAAEILGRRKIFSDGCLELIALAEGQSGLSKEQAARFVEEALKTFRWHGEATVDASTYRQLRGAHALIADIVCFQGPHINHLTPRVLDIDGIQAAMPGAEMKAKDRIEGPPSRQVPILLRQTSFLAVEEPIRFIGNPPTDGSHTARFGEVEQRGCALTRSGRHLYDELLAKSRRDSDPGLSAEGALRESFAEMPDDLLTLYRQGLVHVTWQVNAERLRRDQRPHRTSDIDELLAEGWLRLQPQIYEDFLPVSAAGIFRSNLGGEVRDEVLAKGDQEMLEAALGVKILDEFELYATAESASLQEALSQLRSPRIAAATQ